MRIILTQPGIRRHNYLTVWETELLLCVLNIIEKELGGLVRGNYSLTYDHFLLGSIEISTHLRWHEACSYFRQMHRLVGLVALKINVQIHMGGTLEQFNAHIAATALAENALIYQGGGLVDF
ncbi:hypothetical protein Tco_1292260 [Tanacetum coccineum]